MTCYKCHREFNPCAMRSCPKTGQTVCRYCCMRCKEVVRADVGETCALLPQKSPTTGDKAKGVKRHGRK